MKKILITGGAGFVGSTLALQYKRDYPKAEVIAFDNLKRRGSEINLPVFKQNGVTFMHGDIRNPSDLAAVEGNFDLFLECSAEPSVMAGVTSSPNYLLETNLVGTLHCLELARARVGATVFLSTSRVYSMQPLKEIATTETDTRFAINDKQTIPGVSTEGIAEEFPTHLPRSFYGMSKLASEMAVQEYVHNYKMKAVINRCGVIGGPGQFGKVDQGVFTMWVANHCFNKPLRYTGFGGTGKQVRDLLHPLDLYALIRKQVSSIDRVNGEVFNVGGGKAGSCSLAELTKYCREIVGTQVKIDSLKETGPVDVPVYISDCARAQKAFDWRPERSVETIVRETAAWVRANEQSLKHIF